MNMKWEGSPESLWGDEKVLYLDLGGDYGDMYINATHQAVHLRSVEFKICKLHLKEEKSVQAFS